MPHMSHSIDETPDGYQFFLDMGPLANADKKFLKGGISFWNEMMT